MGYEWTDLAYQQIGWPATRRCSVFPLCVLLVFLVLAAQYESWSLPLAVILIVPMACCARLAASGCRRRQQHLHADRLPGAGGPGLQERHPDRRVRPQLEARAAIAVEAVLEAARLRLRPS